MFVVGEELVVVRKTRAARCAQAQGKHRPAPLFAQHANANAKYYWMMICH